VKCLLTFTCVLLSSFGFPASSFSAQPNVLLIVAGDPGCGAPGCYGVRDIPTPQLDSLAANGVRFTDAYVTVYLPGA
jgi:arylsulfatase A-like enzyme